MTVFLLLLLLCSILSILQFHVLHHNVRKLMALVSVDQAALDTLATNLEAVKTALSAEIADLEAQVTAGNLPPASLDGLNTALADLQALEPPAPAPAP